MSFEVSKESSICLEVESQKNCSGNDGAALKILLVG
jgi:hypothetical protein